MQRAKVEYNRYLHLKIVFGNKKLDMICLLIETEILDCSKVWLKEEDRRGELVEFETHKVIV